MYSKLTFVLLATVFATCLGAYTCRTGTVVNRPVNNQPYTFPINWDDNQTAPALAAGQDCSWVVTIPQGYYAKLIISGDLTDSVGYIQMVDTNGNVQKTKHENKNPYFFPSPKFTLIVDNQAAATFAFKVVWAPFPVGTSFEALVDLYAKVVDVTKEVFAGKLDCSNSCSMFSFPVDTISFFNLRSVLVFSGLGYNGTYLTSLYQMYKNPMQWIGPPTILYIVNLQASGADDKLLVQSSAFTSDIKLYEELNCIPSSTCTIPLNNGPGKSGLVYAGNQNQTLTDIFMDKTATLTVYYGSQTHFALYKTYQGSTIQKMLPLTFKGGFMTNYIISAGKSIFTFSLSG
ncbi:hypothetical protein CAEBREN_20316 [Caenorhabditis brenneri]|uniref:CUB-like domain-containing protein n=1 Tax=Caenorhabditis brenneri TaxID=135651 RepID=G0N5B1_CAEBE|nr:hypothetical protein CAEBREN_20316 [Caenorhabditis brenneri]